MWVTIAEQTSHGHFQADGTSRAVYRGEAPAPGRAGKGGWFLREAPALHLHDSEQAQRASSTAALRPFTCHQGKPTPPVKGSQRRSPLFSVGLLITCDYLLQMPESSQHIDEPTAQETRLF